MKKILILLVSIIIAFISLSCSKDHSAPTFDKYTVPKPSNVVATYISASENMNVSWEMTLDTDVVGYQVAVSDSSEFDLGTIFYDETKLKNINFDVSQRSGNYYVKVGAIFTNNNLKNFFGPLSDETAFVSVQRED